MPRPNTRVAWGTSATVTSQASLIGVYSPAPTVPTPDRDTPYVPTVRFVRPENLDDEAVARLASAMSNKFRRKRGEGRSGWSGMTTRDLEEQFKRALIKGNIVDIANFLAMLHYNGMTKLGVHNESSAIEGDSLRVTNWAVSNSSRA